MEKIIRLATPADVAAIRDIYAPSVLNTPASFEVELASCEEFKSRMGEVLEKFPWLVCEIDKEVVGYAYASAHRSRCAYAWSVESTVYVKDSFHNQGIGRALYAALFPMIKNQGVVNVFAGITLPNAGSIRLHESLGFAHIGTYKDVGFKLGKWWDVGWWQLQLQRPEQPKTLKSYL